MKLLYWVVVQFGLSGSHESACAGTVLLTSGVWQWLLSINYYRSAGVQNVLRGMPREY